MKDPWLRPFNQWAILPLAWVLSACAWRAYRNAELAWAWGDEFEYDGFSQSCSDFLTLVCALCSRPVCVVFGNKYIVRTGNRHRIGTVGDTDMPN